MSRAITETTDVVEEEPLVTRRELTRWLITYAVLCLTVGALCGFIWFGVVILPTYVIQPDGTGVLDERATAAVFSIDAWFSFIGLWCGAGVGYVAWKWFRPMAWWLVGFAVGGAVVSSLMCWLVGVLLKPDAMVDRLAVAKVGDKVPIDFELHAPVALAVWVFAAMIPILALSALTVDPEDLPLDA